MEGSKFFHFRSIKVNFSKGKGNNMKSEMATKTFEYNHHSKPQFSGNSSGSTKLFVANLSL